MYRFTEKRYGGGTIRLPNGPHKIAYYAIDESEKDKRTLFYDGQQTAVAIFNEPT
ncbi:MAG: hypothetical protein GY771_04310 [bacterium]|nr:hypothetical protein [bacterium]